MKKSILLVALCAFSYTTSASLVHIHKDTEVCSFSKTGSPHCYYKKQKPHHHKQKQKPKSIKHKRISHQKTHHKHLLKHQSCKK